MSDGLQVVSANADAMSAIADVGDSTRRQK